MTTTLPPSAVSSNEGIDAGSGEVPQENSLDNYHVEAVPPNKSDFTQVVKIKTLSFTKQNELDDLNNNKI